MKKLELSDWASIAEVIGAIAVVVSLIYVGFQISANTAEIRASNRQHLINRSGEATLTAASNPQLAKALIKAAAGEPLSSDEYAQYSYFVRGMQYDIQEAYLLFIEDRLDESYWRTRAAIFMAYMQSSSAREVYSRDRELGVLHPEFVVWADHAMREL